MLEERDARIAVLEAENAELRERAGELVTILDALNAEIAGKIEGEVSGVSCLSDFQLGTWCRQIEAIAGMLRAAAESLAGAQPSAATYPTHSEGGAADKSPSAKSNHEDDSRTQRANTASEGPHIAQPLSDEGSAAALRSQAEANVLAVRSWDAPGFPACVKREMEKIKSARSAISPMQVQHANEAWNRLPEGARVDDRMKAALETLGAYSPNAALAKDRWPDLRVSEVEAMKAAAEKASRYLSLLQIFAHRTGALAGDDVIEHFHRWCDRHDRQMPHAASPSPSALTEEVREKADLAICGIGHLLSHLPDDDNGFSEMKNEDLLYIYAVYVAELMKRDPTDPVGVMFAHLTKPSTKGGT